MLAAFSVCGEKRFGGNTDTGIGVGLAVAATAEKGAPLGDVDGSRYDGKPEGIALGAMEGVAVGAGVAKDATWRA